MVVQSLNWTSIWDDNYMVLNSQYENRNVNNDLANALQEYVASTINKSNIGGDNFFVSGDTSSSTLRENFENSSVENNKNESNNSDDKVNSISEYISKKCANLLPEGETEETYKFNANPESIGGDPYSLCKLGIIIDENKKESMSDYQKRKVNEQKEKLKKKSRNSTKQVKMAIEKFNLRETSLPELYNNVMNTLYSIIEDLTNFNATGADLNKNIQNLIKIFFGNNRIMYVGIIVVIVSFILYLLDTSSS
jgi:hypothetical protein